MNKPNKKGFTLVELIVVIVILGILAVVVIPAFSSYSAKANEATCATTRRTLLGELSAEQIFNEDKNLAEVSKSTDEGKAFLAKTECPSGGTITVSENEIYYSKHGKTISEKGLMEAFEEVIVKSSGVNHSYNDTYRKTLYEQFQNGWPAIVLDGKVLYMQPYLYKNTNLNIETKLIYANTNKDYNVSSFANAIYDSNENIWYVAKGTGGYSVTNQTPEQVIAEIKKRNNDTDEHGKPNTANDWIIVKP